MMIEALLANNEAEAESQIKELIAECRDGLSDREGEAIKLAKRWGLVEEWVIESFGEARRLRELLKIVGPAPLKPPGASFILPAIQPIVEATSVAVEVPPQPEWAQQLAAVDWLDFMAKAAKAVVAGTVAEAAARAEARCWALDGNRDGAEAEFQAVLAEARARAESKAQAEPKPLKEIMEGYKPGRRQEEAKKKVKLEAEAAKSLAIPEAPAAPPDAEGFERLTYAPGLLGHMTQYIYDSARLPDRTISFAAALTAAGKMLDGKVLGPSGNSTVLYNWLIAETGSGKQHALNCIRMLLRAAGREKVMVAGGLASVQSIEEIVEGKGEDIEAVPDALVIIDEIGSWLARISSKGQTGNVSEIPSLLCSLWGWPLGVAWTGTKKVGKEMKQVYGIAFSIFGASTRDALVRTLKSKDISGGFISRNLYFNAGVGAAEPVDSKYDWQSLPSWLSKTLKAIVKDLPISILEQPMRLAFKSDDGEVLLRDYRRIDWGPGAKELSRQYEIKIRSIPVSTERELWIRAPEIALRIATIVAVLRRSTTVDVEDLSWAIDIVDWSMGCFQQDLEDNMQEDISIGDLVKELRAQWRKHGVMTIGGVHKFCERKTGEKDFMKIDRAIDHLVKCGEIIKMEPSSGPGRPTESWRWHGWRGSK